MARVQLALDVDDLDHAVDFYRRLFATPPHKRRPGYANFEVADPPLKLVLLERPGAGGALNHLGVEVATTGEVRAAHHRAAEAGLATRAEDDTVCCHARQDKFWTTDPGGLAWEVYTVTDDDPDASASGSSCCITG